MSGGERGGEAMSPDPELRRRAEAVFLKEADIAEPATAQEAAALLHELRVHQIELEMQNEELRRARDELETSRARYVELFDSAPVGYLTLGEKGRIIEANLPAAALLGEERAQLYGRHLTPFVLEPDQDDYSRFIQRLSKGALREMCELRLAQPAGEPPWVRLEATTFPANDGGDLHIRMALSDVSARRRAEDEIVRLNSDLSARVVSRTEQLDAATRELEALAYSLAHDVRAPLRAIDGFSAVVILDEGDALRPESRDALQRVRAAAQRLGRLMDDLMSLSDASRRDLARQTVDVSALATEVGEELAAGAASRQVELVVRPGLTAEADPALVRLILRELLDNAWKFSREREIAHVEVGALHDDGERAFFVRDDGAGFDGRPAEHLFGAFQKMHAGDEYEGDGIGLARVQRLVRRHGGRVWAEAAVDKGATFFFTIPEPAGDLDARA